MHADHSLNERQQAVLHGSALVMRPKTEDDDASAAAVKMTKKKKKKKKKEKKEEKKKGDNKRERSQDASDEESIAKRRKHVASNPFQVAAAATLSSLSESGAKDDASMVGGVTKSDVKKNVGEKAEDCGVASVWKSKSQRKRGKFSVDKLSSQAGSGLW